MIAFFHRHKCWMWTLCIALLVVRISGAHWHLCLDGSEPPATLHAGDTVADHHRADNAPVDRHAHNHADGSHHAASQHTDVDLNLVDDGLFKLFSKHFPALLTLLAFLLLIVPTSSSARTPYAAPFFPQLALHRSPPPRGPPR